MVQYAEAKTARQLIQNVVSPLLSHIKDSFLLRKPFLTWRKSGFHVHSRKSLFLFKDFFFLLNEFNVFIEICLLTADWLINHFSIVWLLM